MPLTQAIDLPAPTRAGGGLLGAARPLPAGWERGVTFSDTWCLAPQPWPFCIGEVSPSDSPGEKQASSPEAPAEFEPVGIVAGVNCSTLSPGDSQETATQVLLATADYRLGVELATAPITGNPSLSEGTPVTAGGAGLCEALATAEATVADILQGRLAYVHVTWGDLTRLVCAQAIWRDGARWRTAAGNLVVASAGYAFHGEIHVTGEVFASTSPIDTRSDIDRQINSTEAYAEQLGLAAFAPCANFYVTEES